jgi:mannosylglycerate hydrolase
MKKWTAIVVSHTHWDREWYLTFQGFRRRLVRLTDRLLSLMETNPRYKYYIFDGQTIVLEDYLEIRPENEERIRKLVQEGRLHIGPWYVLPDEFLVSGEALVRNLLIGHLIAEKFGRVMKVGYLPDPFGHIAQMPQILQGFGIKSFMFHRGLGDEWEGLNTEFWWEGLDGTKVLAIYQMHGYCNLAGLGYEPPFGEPGTVKVDMDKAVETIRREVESLKPFASTRYILLNNGCDHLEPQPELPDMIDYANSKLEDIEVVHSTFEEYVEKVLSEEPKLGTVKGELHRGRYHPLLLGVFSTRLYLKKENFATQRALEKYAEPISSLAWLKGKPYEGAFLLRAWKYLISNHPHDSICGCSVDEVHRDMLPRFAAARQIADIMFDESTRYIVDRINSKKEGARAAVVVFNPHSWTVTDVAKLHIEFPVSPDQTIHNIIVRDETGKIVASQLENIKVSLPYHPHPLNQLVWSGDISISAENVPPLGYKTYYLEEVRETKRISTLLIATPTSLENAFLRVDMNPNGTIDITDKRSGQVFRGCNLFEDTEDIGDEYNYSPAPNSETITSSGANAHISLLQRGPVSATIKVQLTLYLPESIDETRTSRSKELVPCPITSYITLHAGIPRIDIETIFENKAKDHRLRVHFPTNLFANDCLADVQFGVLRRNIQLPKGEGWVEKPVGMKAMQSFVAVESRGLGLCVVSEGMPEYEPIDTPQGVDIALTLLRSVGWLSRGDLLTRPYNAGPQVPTPDAQCLGTHIARYAIIPFVNSFEEAKPWLLAYQFVAPLRSVVTFPKEGSLPTQYSLLKIEPEELVLSALKKAEKEDALILRFYNIASYEVEGKITFTEVPKKVVLSNLAEEDVEQMSADKELEVKVKPYQIITLKLSF